MTLGHNRFSTNTLSSFFRVQPFSVLGHNGEINTIAKLSDEAKMIGVPIAKDGSDSQDLNKTIETFICRHGYSLFEAVDLMFPPIINEIKEYPEHLQDLYTYLREAWGHFAQGPAGIISRFGDEAVFTVDSLGFARFGILKRNHPICSLPNQESSLPVNIPEIRNHGSRGKNRFEMERRPN